jgi:hypothetical protein
LINPKRSSIASSNNWRIAVCCGIMGRRYGDGRGVRAKKQQNLDALLEMILLTSDLLELKANPESSGLRRLFSRPSSTAAEERLPRCLCSKGTLKSRDPFYNRRTSGSGGCEQCF